MSPSPLALELAQSEGAEAGGYRQEPQSQLCKPILVDNALCGVRRTVSFKPSNTGFRDAAVKCSDRLLYLLGGGWCGGRRFRSRKWHCQ